MKLDLKRIDFVRARVGRSGPSQLPSFPLPGKRTTRWSAVFRAREDRGTLRRHGGSKTTEDAVDLGLRWLAEHQDPEGFWDCDLFMKMDRIAPI